MKSSKKLYDYDEVKELIVISSILPSVVEAIHQRSHDVHFYLHPDLKTVKQTSSSTLYWFSYYICCRYLFNYNLAYLTKIRYFIGFSS